MHKPSKSLALLALIACLVLCGCAHTQDAASGLPSTLGLEPPEGELDSPSLLLDRPVGELPVVEHVDWNDWASDSPAGATLVWWLALTV